MQGDHVDLRPLPDHRTHDLLSPESRLVLVFAQALLAAAHSLRIIGPGSLVVLIVEGDPFQSHLTRRPGQIGTLGHDAAPAREELGRPSGDDHREVLGEPAERQAFELGRRTDDLVVAEDFDLDDIHRDIRRQVRRPNVDREPGATTAPRGMP